MALPAYNDHAQSTKEMCRARRLGEQSMGFSPAPLLKYVKIYTPVHSPLLNISDSAIYICILFILFQCGGTTHCLFRMMPRVKLFCRRQYMQICSIQQAVRIPVLPMSPSFAFVLIYSSRVPSAVPLCPVQVTVCTHSTCFTTCLWSGWGLCTMWNFHKTSSTTSGFGGRYGRLSIIQSLPCDPHDILGRRCHVSRGQVGLPRLSHFSRPTPSCRYTPGAGE